ncbi:MAG: glycyl-tRNA synthetase beta chain [Sphingomonadales bacterium]|nr:glycyl-tRNA synthetase beta chain [Sphingomonadales bacterium]
MPDFLLELLSEEIPARMQGKAQQDLARLFSEQISSAGLAAEAIETYATPRRLALIARGLPAETEAVREETKGPRASAPPQALEGFLRKTGLTRDQLEERDGVLFAVVDKPGRLTSAVLAEAIPALFRAFPWPKSMRWGTASASSESPRWVRPLQGIVALLGEEIVEFEIAGIRSGAATIGHRFHHPGIITLGGVQDYLEKLQACHVLVDPAERVRLIAEGARAAAAAAGLTLVEDEGLLAENAGLTEWPVPLLGRFDPAFLEVPREVIQLTMRTNQKYFACTDMDGALAPNFVCTANIEASDGGAAVIAGNERVLSARLADAKFFWEQDLRVPLEKQAEKLREIVFHEKLGTVADKVGRVVRLARWLVEEGIVGGDGMSVERLADLTETAARLAKADLVTGLVGEFPELQGVIGGHLALCQGHSRVISDAIRDHYKPVGQGDEVPTAPVTVAVSLADKLDSLAGFFAGQEQPTGSKDPFALRRAILGVIRLVQDSSIRCSWRKLFAEASEGVYQPLLMAALSDLGEEAETLSEIRWPNRPDQDDYGRTQEVVFAYCVDAEKVSNAVEGAPLELAEFLIDRLKVQQREAGVRHDLIDAVFALGGEDDLVRLLARVKALQAFVETPEGADLLAGYKRAANILKKEGYVTPAKAGVHADSATGSQAEWMPASAGMTEQEANKPLPYAPEIEEAALIAALDSAEPRARVAVEAEDFGGAMAALASLRAPVDAFFDKVTVNDPDPAKREARLALLARMRDAVHRVADFSRIEG